MSRMEELKYTVVVNNDGEYGVCEDKNVLPSGYNTCPCYVLKSNEVVLLYDYNSGNLCDTIYNKKGKCENSVKVNYLFDDYDKARIFVDGLNSVLRARVEIYAYTHFYGDSYNEYSSKLANLLHEYSTNIDKCYEEERKMLMVCGDLIDSRKLEYKKTID